MEHIKIHENVVGKLGTEDEEPHPGAVLDTDDADGRKPPARLPECLLCNCGIGVPTFVCLELWELLLDHEPAQPEPGAHEGAIDGEVEEEHQPDVSSVGHGGWGHMVIKTSANDRMVTWQHEHAPARHLTSDEYCCEEQTHPHLLAPTFGRFHNFCHC